MQLYKNMHENFVGAFFSVASNLPKLIRTISLYNMLTFLCLLQ